MHLLYFPAEVTLPSLELYASAGYWQCCSVVTAAVTIAVFLRQLVAGEDRRAQLEFTIAAGLLPLACVLSWMVCLALWWPTYILALIPWAGYFPATGTSVLEMDQITSLLAVAIVAAIRIGRLIAKASPSADASTSEEHELAPLLPT
ncbi:hypothetical protein C8J57DRAFT_1352317 [Mycena rebaudengoi]|nr:hypothetical protein C8J57DRAFT_1352317 [Mycena rebaudengoi]